MSLMMVREMFVKELRGHELEDGVSQELQPLVGTQSQVVESNGTVCERSKTKYSKNQSFIFTRLTPTETTTHLTETIHKRIYKAANSGICT